MTDNELIGDLQKRVAALELINMTVVSVLEKDYPGAADRVYSSIRDALDLTIANGGIVDCRDDVLAHVERIVGVWPFSNSAQA